MHKIKQIVLIISQCGKYLVAYVLNKSSKLLCKFVLGVGWLISEDNSFIKLFFVCVCDVFFMYRLHFVAAMQWGICSHISDSRTVSKKVTRVLLTVNNRLFAYCKGGNFKFTSWRDSVISSAK